MPRAAIHSKSELDGARESALKVVEVHRALAAYLHEGQTLAQIDTFVARTLEGLGSRSCFLGYRTGRLPPFPSHACLSVNECVVHGTAAYRLDPLKVGDVLKIDIGVAYRGWIGDAAWTYVFGEPSEQVRRLTDCGKRSIAMGIDAIRPGGQWIDWARAVAGHVEDECGFHLIRGLGGHGYGRKLHCPPFVSNVPPSPYSAGEWPDAHRRIEPGTLVALEPMIAVGTGNTVPGRHKWPILTADGSLSVHYEHDVYIADDGPVVLTAGLNEINDVIV